MVIKLSHSSLVKTEYRRNVTVSRYPLIKLAPSSGNNLHADF